MKTKQTFKRIEDIVIAAASMFKPPERLSVSQAATRYRYLRNAGAYQGPWLNAKTPYMVEPMDVLDSREFDGCVFVGPAQSGKPLAIDTPVPIPTGWTTLGEIRTGDQVFDRHGNLTEVTYITPVFEQRDCYRITFDDGSSVVADGVHRWAVCDTWATDPHSLQVKDTNSLREAYRITTSKGSHRYRYSIPLAGALQLPDADLPIEPYLLGLWLGDGHHISGALHLGSKDFDAIANSLEARGSEILGITEDNDRGTAKRVVTCDSNGRTLQQLIREHGLLGRKHIPAAYLRASEHQRRELLRGLMDTDGTVGARGRLQISQSNKTLADGVVELITSLGYKPMRDQKMGSYTKGGIRIKTTTSFRISFSAEDASGCFTLDRHIEKHRSYTAATKTRPNHFNRRFIRDISPVESVPVKCISVRDESHLFLVGEQMVPTHNTDALLLNWITYSVTCDPMDMIIYSPTTAAARDFSVRRVDRLNRHSPKVGAKLLKRRDSDNKFDKHYTNGMMLNLSWPSVTEMAGKPVPRVALTDYDRMDDDIDGDGSPFDLASKRTTTFGSFKMALAESSPSKPIIDTRWIAESPHEAPPANGILALYNRGDRRCWYWPCPHCDQYFEGKFEHLVWQDTGDPLTSSESVRMKCPHCGELIHPDERHEMQQWGMWLKDGQGIDPEGRRFGKGRRTSIASFWLRGVAASFVTWKRLVEVYLLAEEEYRKTGSEEALKKFYNTDLGEAYLPKAVDSDRLPEHLKTRAERYADLDDDDAKIVPHNSRMLIATVDVQKNLFVVQIHAILPGSPFDIALVDRFRIKQSNRYDEDTGEILWVKPATYLEDWDLLIEQVMNKTYPLADGSGRHMAVKLTVCDSGGYSKDKGESVTSMAYAFYRRLRDEGLHGRFHLLKGESKPGIPRTRITYPDSSDKNQWAAARGDVPVLMLNSNALKDALHARLDCIQPGKGMYRFPTWLADWWYQEMCSEFRTPKGWEKYSHSHNEAWDLSYYCIGACISKLINIEGIDWSNPPAWAAEWDENILISQPNEPKKFAESINNTYDFGKYATALA